jgi:hypothetical protein
VPENIELIFSKICRIVAPFSQVDVDLFTYGIGNMANPKIRCKDFIYRA